MSVILNNDNEIEIHDDTGGTVTIKNIIITPKLNGRPKGSKDKKPRRQKVCSLCGICSCTGYANKKYRSKKVTNETTETMLELGKI